MATDRLLSPKYLQAGMGDGGGCHPRDNIALSWLARDCGLSFDFFTALMQARERHCEWLATVIQQRRYVYTHTSVSILPVFLLGRSFKPETNIETGSPAILLSRILRDKGIPHSSQEDVTPTARGLYFIATKHERFRKLKFPEGSIVIDPFRYIPEQEGVKLISIGAGQKTSVRKEAMCG
jgi:UDPglucose 6-dehydrogenase